MLIRNNGISSLFKINILAINYNLSTFKKKKKPPFFHAITNRCHNGFEFG